jgi:hypothetical protein
MQFGNADKVALCNAVARHLNTYSIPIQCEFATYLRALPREKKVMAGAQILKAYHTGKQYGLKEAFSKLDPNGCNPVETVAWPARHEIYHSMDDAFNNSENSRKFIKLLEKNLADKKFRCDDENDDKPDASPFESEDDGPVEPLL